MQNDFYNLYYEMIENPASLNSSYGGAAAAARIIDIGMNTMHQSQDINTKDDILNKLLLLFPDNTEIYYQKGLLFKDIAPQRAMAWFKMCFNITPDKYENLVELSILLIKSGMLNVFMTLNKNGLFENIIYKRPNNYEFLEVYINAFQPRLLYKHVIPCFLKMIEQRCKKPAVTPEEKRGKWWVYHHLGFAYIVNGSSKKAIEYTTKALDLADKFDLGIHAKLLSYQNMVAFYDFDYHDQMENFRRYLKINDYLPNVRDMFRHAPRAGKKIRVGYVSSDFVDHPVSNFILPILRNHNREHFEVFVFTNTKNVNEQLQARSYNSYAIEDMDGKTAAKFIHQKNIDVLIDLNGHTVKNRLDIFAYNPAPVQMTYLGYPNTTGLTSIKYRITDTVADNPYTSQPYSETLIRLPTCFLLYQSIRYHNVCDPKEIDPKRIILAGLNKEKKNSLHVLRTWGTILRECPNAFLVIKLETMDIMDERVEYYEKVLDVDKSRFQLWNKLKNDDYDNMFSEIDILLDTYPYSGTTTTCETLLHSIPVVTMKHKDYHCHNVSASILTQSGLSELVAGSPEEYIALVKYLVYHPEKIREYKRTIHSKFKKGMNVENFMAGYEAAIRNVVL